MVDKLKTVETSNGAVTLRDIKLRDNREARSYAQRNGQFNDQDYYTKLIFLIADKDKKFLDELTREDDMLLVECVISIIENTKVSDTKKQL